MAIGVLVILAAAATVLAFAWAAQGLRPPVPLEQGTPAAVLDLARCMVAEASFRQRRDHAAIPHAIAWQWKQRVKRRPAWTYHDQTRWYCQALKPTRKRSLAPRHHMIRALNLAGLKPAHWDEVEIPSSWSRHRAHWLERVDQARAFFAGRLRNPCPGAVGWYGRVDIQRDRVASVVVTHPSPACAPPATANTFVVLGRGKPARGARVLPARVAAGAP